MILTNKDKLYTYFNINYEGKRYFIKVSNNKMIKAQLSVEELKDFILDNLSEA